jgi:hypothetical protein
MRAHEHIKFWHDATLGDLELRLILKLGVLACLPHDEEKKHETI